MLIQSKNRFELKFNIEEALENPILDKIAHFNSVNRKNKKRDKSKKEDLSRSVDPIAQFSKQNIN